ncbi:HAMP domain-containing sensor histidine kinase [Actinoplanes sp. Pm04-4]|uniref:histidine kinase n=1 Tax=Paractinoplanes pyxinae TaxID=2997416 RepID=A0ABT4BE55_9ACTN|nr:HAMP domain-containing sensor histidine kinase [Actinoplanes pyxinae]MCY1144803.1 HAMP domain-containing sensor histidine kinase [Actinoplanes pyxinae]
MQDAARDLGRPPRLIAGFAGAAIALAGVAAVLMSLENDPPDGYFAVPAVVLVPAGFALAWAAMKQRRITGDLRAALAAAVQLREKERAEAAQLREQDRAEAAQLREQDRAEAAQLREKEEKERAETAKLRAESAESAREAARLREAHKNLETALTFKNDLTSMLTHDVAQPISSIASLAELLRADWDDLPDDIRLELATKIDKNTQRLIKMMNDLQLLFRLDTGSVTARRNPVPLKEVAESVAEGPGDVRVEIDDDTSVLADRGHVQIVLQNLVKNALAYGETPVLVTAERRAEQVELAVQDSGPGISDELLPTLFGRFVRGAGLGLFIVRHLVEANGGSIRYEHATPHGARMLLTWEAAGSFESRPLT